MYFLFGIYHAITIESQKLTKDMLFELLEGAFSARDYKKRLVLAVVRQLVAHVGGYDEDLVAWMESQKVEPPPYLLNEVKRNKRRGNRKGKNTISLNYMGRSSSSRVALTRSRANLRKTESNLQAKVQLQTNIDEGEEGEKSPPFPSSPTARARPRLTSDLSEQEEELEPNPRSGPSSPRGPSPRGLNRSLGEGAERGALATEPETTTGTRAIKRPPQMQLGASPVPSPRASLKKGPSPAMQVARKPTPKPPAKPGGGGAFF